MIIRLFLRLFLAALVILMIADVFYELHLNWISHLIIQLGDDILLLSFALFFITGCVFFSQQISGTIKAYFSEKQQAQRRLFFNLARNNYLQRLFNSKKQQLRYFSELKRARLLDKNNKKHCTLLAKAILAELNQVKNKLPETQFQQHQQAIKQACVQQQIHRLLELQREISKTP